MEGYLGMIKLILGTDAPENWILCNGEGLKVVNYPELFLMIQNRFGGDGVDNFNLPDLPNPPQGNYVIQTRKNPALSNVKGMISQICLYTGTDLPEGWMFCDGRVLSGKEYPVLLRTMGNNYGGDGETTVGLPNMQAIPGINYVICVSGTDPTGGSNTSKEEEDDDDY